MGKASSAKKVAKVARSSGGSGRERVKLGFPLAIFAIVVIGTLGIVWGRDQASEVAAESPTLADHWHNAYGIYICDSFAPPLSDIGEDRTGIHTHDDGLIHIHPFARASAGDRATWGVFAESVGINLGSNSFTMPAAETYENGYECADGSAEVALYHWPADDLDSDPTVITSDFASASLDSDGDLWVLAVVAEGTEVPKPPAAADLGAVSGAVEFDPAGGAGAEGFELPLDLDATTEIELPDDESDDDESDDDEPVDDDEADPADNAGS